MTVDTIAPGALAVRSSVSSMVAEWATDMSACNLLAEQIVDTEHVPVSYWPLPKGVKAKDVMARLPLANESQEAWQHRRRIAVATTAGTIYRGAQLGKDWPWSVNAIYMIGGRPSLYAEAMVDLIKSDGHTVRVLERSRERCEITTLRRGDTEWQTFEYTIDDARLANYVPGFGSNTGNDSWKGNAKYLTDPKAMLYARCASVMAKTVYPDVLGGMSVVEVVRDDASDVEVTATVAPTSSRVDLDDLPDVPAPPIPAAAPASSAAAPRQDGPAAGGTGEGAPAAEVEKPKRARKTAEPKPEPAASADQIEAFVTLASELGMTTPEQRRAYIADQIDDFDPGAGLTAGQALALVDALGVLFTTKAVAEQDAAEQTYRAQADERAQVEATAVDQSEPDGWA